MVGFTSHVGGGPEPNGWDGESDIVTFHIQGGDVVDESAARVKRQIMKSPSLLHHTLNNPPRLPARMAAPMMATYRKTMAQTPSAAASSVPLPRVDRSV